MSLSAKRIGRLVMIFAMLATCGAHWGFLQSIAWTSMLAEKSERMPIREAVRQTFDGQHPCALCEDIRKERKSVKVVVAKPSDFVLPARALQLFPPPGVLQLTDPAASSSSISFEPPHPPPRVA